MEWYWQRKTKYLHKNLSHNHLVTSEFTAIVSGHGKTKSYLHMFKFIDNPMCPCNGEAQITDHLIHDCQILQFQRKTMKHHIQKSGGTWPTTNRDLVAKCSHVFIRFIKSIDFYKLQWNIYIYSQTSGKINLHTKPHLGNFDVALTVHRR
jgi:hypothetical protein